MPMPGSRTRNGALRTRRIAVVACAAAALLCCWLPAAVTAGPATTRLVYAAGEIVPIPASVPHEEGDMVDRRIVPDLRWLAAHFPIYVVDGYSGPLPNGEHAGCHACHVRHSDHYNGVAVDIVPLHGGSGCDGSWRPITRLAHWAEPVQNHPAPPFRWVGYDGDAGHGCGNHLHLSWEHALAPEFQLAEWVTVFPVRSQEVAPHPRGGTKPAPTKSEAPKSKPPAPKAADGPVGGISVTQSGGVAARGD
jgi:hypothetical protein